MCPRRILSCSTRKIAIVRVWDVLERSLETLLSQANDRKINRRSILSERKAACGKKTTAWIKYHHELKERSPFWGVYKYLQLIYSIYLKLVLLLKGYTSEFHMIATTCTVLVTCPIPLNNEKCKLILNVHYFTCTHKSKGKTSNILKPGSACEKDHLYDANWDPCAWKFAWPFKKQHEKTTYFKRQSRNTEPK